MANVIITKEEIDNLLSSNKFIKGPNWYLILPTNKDLEYQRSINRNKNSSIKKCIICQTKFDYGYSNSKTCGACKLISYCVEEDCNNWYIKEKNYK